MTDVLQRISSLRVVILLAAALLNGCGGFTAINGEDKNVFFPSLRIGYPLFDRYDQHGQSDHALEADVSRGAGAGHQTLTSSQSISLAGTILQGPADVQQDFTLDMAQVALRFRFPQKARVFVQLLTGYRYTNLDLSLRSGSLAAQRTLRDGEFVAGVGMGSRVTDHLLLDLRLASDINYGQERRQMQSMDFLASYWLSPNIALTAGWRRWQYSKGDEGESDIDMLVWQGYSAGLAFSF